MGALDAVSIRLANRQDLPAITTCIDAAYTHYIERIGKKPAPMLADCSEAIAAGHVWLIPGLREANDIRGVLVMMPEETAMFVENIAVHPAWQGQGFGHVLMNFVERCAREAGLSAIRLYTNELMTENLRFYQKLGFVETARREENGYRRVLLQKALE